jgi:hypothetical protein
MDPSFPHALSGNPGNPELDPRLKHSGVTLSGNPQATLNNPLCELCVSVVNIPATSLWESPD